MFTHAVQMSMIRTHSDIFVLSFSRMADGFPLAGRKGTRMTKKLIFGTYAAVLVPRDSQGDLDEAALVRHLEFLLTHGIENFAFNGATGEYCLTSSAELERCLQIAKTTLPARAKFLCGVGAAGLRGTLALGRLSIEAGALGLLVPMPYFFPYAQDDLAAFVHAVASELPVPMLLYNLPKFTSGLEIATITDLLQECGNVIGIKDSSGSLAILRAITQAGIVSSRLCGNDEVLPQALIEGVCDGAVSGVACVVPELIEKVFANSPASPGFRKATELLHEFIARIDVLPCPWGLKAIAEARGIARATYLLPSSARRAKQINDLQSWYKE
jgi:dihydrodipicolinate synthase/N-acetylneuraminate lyase